MPYLTGALALAVALAAPPAPITSGPEQGLRVQVPAKKEQKQKKVWTNEDLEALQEGRRAPGSEMGAEAAKEAPPAEGEAAKGTSAAEAGAAGPTKTYVKEQDPKWYREQIAPLRAEIDRIDGEIRRIRGFKDAPSSGTNSFSLGQSNMSLSPENQILQLEKKRGEVQAKLDELESLARRNGIDPGVVR